MARFVDRGDAGRQLAAALKSLQLDRPVVLAIPRGGVPVAAEVAGLLNGELGTVVARKLGAPGQPELAIGAVTAAGASFVDEDLARRVGASPHYIAEETERQQQEAIRRKSEYGGGGSDLAGREVVVVDDGIATGATAIAALRSVRNAGAARVILAVPVGPRATIQAMRREADEVVCPRIEEDFFAVGQFYVDFRAPGDDEVRRLLRQDADSRRPVGD